MTCRRHYPYPLPNWAQTQTIGLNLGVGKLGHSLPTRCCPPNAHVSHEIVSPITKQNKNNKKKNLCTLNYKQAPSNSSLC